MAEDKKNTVVEPVIEKNEVIPQWAIDLQAKVGVLETENKMLKDMAGNNTIKSYINGHAEKESNKASFKKWNDKLVIGWGPLDYSKFNPSAPDGLRENILTTLFFADGEKELVNYIAFNNSHDVIFLEVKKTVGDMTTVVLPDGKELTIETKFLNNR